MNRKTPFEFTDKLIAANLRDTYVARLPAKIATKEELMRALYEYLQFPSYFGFNWDALLDCLRDFHWIESRTVVLLHADLPKLTPGECQIYLEILAEAVNSWQPGEDHNFKVFFPTTVHAKIAAMLAKY